MDATLRLNTNSYIKQMRLTQEKTRRRQIITWTKTRKEQTTGMHLCSWGFYSSVFLGWVADGGCRVTKVFWELWARFDRTSRRPTYSCDKVGTMFGRIAEALGDNTVELCLWLYFCKTVLAVATRTYCNRTVVHCVIKDWHCARVISISCVLVDSCMPLFYNVIGLMACMDIV